MNGSGTEAMRRPSRNLNRRNLTPSGRKGSPPGPLEQAQEALRQNDGVLLWCASWLQQDLIVHPEPPEPTAG